MTMPASSKHGLPIGRSSAIQTEAISLFASIRWTFVGLLVAAVLAATAYLSMLNIAGRFAALVLAVVAGLAYPPTTITTLLLLSVVPALITKNNSPVPQPSVVFLLLMLATVTMRVSSAFASDKPRELGLPRLLVPVYLLFLAGVFLVDVAIAQDSSLMFVRWPAYCFGLLTALQVRSQRDLSVVMWSLVAASTSLAVWAIGLGGRAALIAAGPEATLDVNYLSCFIGIGIVVLFGFLVRNASLRCLGPSILAAGLLAINSLAILQLASRGMSIAVAGACAAVFLRKYHRPPHWIVIGALAAACIFVVPSLPMFDELLARFAERDMDTLSGRLVLWAEGLTLLGRSEGVAMLLGGGTGSAFEGLRGASTHNSYLAVVLDYGFFGLLSLATVFGFALWRSLRGTETWALAQLGIVLMLGLSSLSLEPTNYIIPWIALGAALPGRTAETARPRLAARIPSPGPRAPIA